MTSSVGDATDSSSSDPAGNTFLGDVWVNFKRWNRKAVRNPAPVVLELFLAVFSLLLFTAVFGDAGELSLQQGGYAGVAYVTFILPAVVMQVSMASSITAGTALVDDLSTGMFEKVVVTPMSWTAVFAGKAAAELLRVALYVLVILALAVGMGASVETGLPGVAGIVGVCLLFASWYMALSYVLALVTRDEESLDAAATILLFPLLFLSSGFLPLSSMPSWIRATATVNPVTYGVDAVRALLLGREVSTVLSVSWFDGMANTLLPSVAVLFALNLVLGTLAVGLLSRASSAAVR